MFFRSIVFFPHVYVPLSPVIKHYSKAEASPVGIGTPLFEKKNLLESHHFATGYFRDS